MTSQTQRQAPVTAQTSTPAPRIQLSRDRTRFLPERQGGVQSTLRTRLVGGLIGRR